VSVDYSLHRPVGRMGITVDRGRNIRSPELGLPGNVGCHVFWDPSRLMTSVEKERWEKVDKAAITAHEIGSTGHVYSTGPHWGVINESTGTKRLRLLLPSDGDVFEILPPKDRSEFIFPVLQPFKALKSGQRALEPWNASRAALVVEIRFSDVLSVLPGSESLLGEICIPFTDICEREVCGWFHVHDVGSKQLDHAEVDDGTPQVFLKFWWIPPKESSAPESDTENDREVSIFVQEEMIRSAILSHQQKLGFVGSSIGALNTVRGLSGNILVVQNTLGLLLDVVEASCNAVNFTVRYLALSLLVLDSL
jgi:hypothetical protein